MDSRVVRRVHGPSFGKAATRYDASGWHSAVSVRFARQRAAGTVELWISEDIVCMVQQRMRLSASQRSRICSAISLFGESDEKDRISNRR
ncbi:hypothetical protein D3C86_1525100 [compost metagenome]